MLAEAEPEDDDRSESHECAKMIAAIREPQRPDTRLLIKLFEGLPQDKAQAFLALAKTMENSDG